MAIKVQFEIGHTAKLKSKKTQEGFTHDWELYVQGVDKSDISQFVEKVVFNLHDSFRKPKRTFKEPPYLLKESGYAGFSFPIDIYFRNRDEPKKVSFNYDLDLQQTGPPVHRSELRQSIFDNPSDDFRQKLLKGGGVPVVASGTIGDEKSRSESSSSSQLVSKPKLSSDPNKKHKIRPDDKMSTFANLFGTPITKTTPKVSPENKPSPGVVSGQVAQTAMAGTGAAKGDRKESLKDGRKEGGSKEKDKSEKRDKHKAEKDKEKKEERESKKSFDEKRDDKKKDKYAKDRERSRDKTEKASKRPASPPSVAKRYPSPKRALSPVRSLSAASRGDEQSTKSNKSSQSESDKKANSSSAPSSKKAKKEKKSHDKDKERDKKDKGERHESKHRDERSNSYNPLPTASNVPAPAPAATTALKNATVRLSDVMKRDKDTSGSGSNDKEAAGGKKDATEKEKKPEKDEKRHKHKKKDKSKDKDKEKDSSKEKDKEKKNKEKALKNREVVESPVHRQSRTPTNLNPVPNPVLAPAAVLPDLSDADSGDSDEESRHTNTEKPLPHSESSNSSFPDLMPASKVSTSRTLPTSQQQQTPAAPTPPPTQMQPQQKPDKVDKKERKNRTDKLDKPDKLKEDKKRRRTSPTPPAANTFVEPPVKQPKKDQQQTLKNGRDQSASPLLSIVSQTPDPEPVKTFRSPAPSTTLPAVPAATNATLNVEYLSELQELHQKIMTLQDNNELQQVVELIAATGKYEITSKTFDFDLCKLDRGTVQRLQDFFATSVS